MRTGTAFQHPRNAHTSGKTHSAHPNCKSTSRLTWPGFARIWNAATVQDRKQPYHPLPGKRKPLTRKPFGRVCSKFTAGKSPVAQGAIPMQSRNQSSLNAGRPLAKFQRKSRALPGLLQPHQARLTQKTTQRRAHPPLLRFNQKPLNNRPNPNKLRPQLPP